MRIAVCCDVPKYVKRIKKYTERWSLGRGIQIQLVAFRNGEEVLFGLEAEGDFSAVFMDIRLYETHVIEEAVRIREQNPQASIVLISQRRQYPDEMSRLYPYQYINKPIREQEIYEVLDKVVDEQRTTFETFSFQYNRMNHNITLRQVLYFVSDRRKIWIMMDDGRKLVFYGKMDLLEKRLSDYNHYFVRTHQSYLVNERQIESFLNDQIQMRNGELLPVSRKKRNHVRQRCMKLWQLALS